MQQVFERVKKSFEPQNLVDPEPFHRQACPSCNASHKFYCPTCYILLHPPSITNPEPVVFPNHVTVDMLLSDYPERSTSAHAKALASEGSVDIITIAKDKEFTVDDRYYDPEKTIILVPTKQAVCLGDLQKHQVQDIKKIIVLDCRWQQVHQIVQQPALRGLRHVKLQHIPQFRSFYWRYPSMKAWSTGESFCTIEALFFFLCELDLALSESGQPLRDLELQSLLYIFKLQYAEIKKHKSSGHTHPASMEYKLSRLYSTHRIFNQKKFRKELERTVREREHRLASKK